MSRLRGVFAVALTILACGSVGCGGSGDGESESKPVQAAQGPNAEKRQEGVNPELNEAELRAAAAKTEKVSGNRATNRMLAQLPGQAGLVVGPPGVGAPDLSGGAFKVGDAWSTIKVPISERVLADAGGPNGLDPVRQDEIRRAITLSDNAAAASLFQSLEQTHGGLEGASEAVGRMLRQAGDQETMISTVGRDSFTTYGQTDWSLDNQYRYMAALAGGCAGIKASSSFLLGQMAQVGGSDVYGLGAAGFPAKWKGGWGPETDGRYLVRQMGTMEVDGKEIVIAMAAIPDDGSFESGQSMLSEIARWTGTQLADAISPPAGC